LVYLYSTIKMTHGPINIRYPEHIFIIGILTQYWTFVISGIWRLFNKTEVDTLQYWWNFRL